MTTPESHHKPKRQRAFLGRILGTSSETPSPKASPTTSVTPPAEDPEYADSITLKGIEDDHGHQIVDKELALDLRNLLPPRLQLDDEWELIYSMDKHGISLNTLYRNSDPEIQLQKFRSSKGGKKASLGYADNIVKNMVVFSHNDVPLGRRPHGYVLAIEDQKGHRFGCYLNEYLRATDKKRYYGNGECFLWKLEWCDTKHNDNRRLKAFMYTGLNDNIIYSNHEFIAIGSSSGNNGLWIDKSLCLGVSYRCETFGNEILNEHGESNHKYGKFKIMNLEVWRVGPLQ